MLQDKKQAKSHRRELQGSPPNENDVAGLFRDAMKQPGYAVEIPFGTADRYYVLSVFREATTPNCTWTLHKCENDSTNLMWTLASNDQRVIVQQLLSDFKTWNQAKQTGSSPPLQASMPLPSTKLYSQGDLRRMQFPNLMRLISADRITGILELSQNNENAEVFFVEGSPVHGELGKAQGDSAIIELVTWSHGEFKFKVAPGTQERSISKHLDLLLMEGAYLQDQLQELNKLNITGYSQLTQLEPEISRGEFDERAANKAGISRGLQKKFFDLVDGKRRVNDIADRLQLNKAEWVPVVHTLVKAKLVGPPAAASETAESQLASVDWSITQAVERSLIRADTGAYGYPALLYLLELEYNRSSRYGKPFSFLILEIGTKKDDSGKLAPLPQEASRELVNLITRLKRKPDILGHFQNTGFGLLLPETDSLLAKRFAARLIEVLMSGPALSSVAFSVGVAGCPHEAQDLPTLIKSCVESRQKFGY